MTRRIIQLVAAAAVTVAALEAGAANLLRLYHDARTDELVATLAFRGTYPDHPFQLQWGPCRNSAQEGAAKEITALIIDADGMDIAKENYTVHARFDLAQLDCRPARVTLRVSPRISRTVFVPARPAPGPR